MLALCPDTVAGKRDRALLALGFAGAYRRSELVALQVEDLADQEGQGAEVAIPRGYRLRPVEAVQTWLAAARSAPARRKAGQARADGAAHGARRGLDRGGVRPVGRAGCRRLQRTQPAQRVPHERCRGGGLGVQDGRPVAAPLVRHAPWLGPARPY